MIRPGFYLCMLMVCPLQAAEPSRQIEFEMELLAINQSTSIRSLAGAWNEPVGKGEDATGIARYSLGIRQGNTTLAYIQRQDLHYHYANDTAQFVYLIENNQALQSDKDYQISIKAQNAASQGLKLDYHWQVSPVLWLKPAITVLQPVELLSGNLSGYARTLAANDYDFEFSSELDYDEDPLFGRNSHSLSGRGYAVDLHLGYEINEQWKLTAAVDDLIGRLFINDAPYTIAQADSSVKNYDENGYAIYDPVVSGFEGYRNVRFDFTPTTHIAVDYRYNTLTTLQIAYHGLPGIDYLQLDFKQTLQASESQIIVHWIPELQAAGLSVQNRYWKMGFITDSLNYGEMKTLGFNFGLYFFF